MSDSGYYYDSEREKKRNDYFGRYSENDGITDILIRLIDEKVKKVKKVKFTVLDLGTGNGFLLREIARRQDDKTNKTATYVGIDSSTDMIAIAQQNSLSGALHFLTMDNNTIEYPDNYFDFVIAKAVTNLSEREIYRILKPGGWFIYKEYGPGKGLVELIESYTEKQPHPGNALLLTFQNLGFQYVEMRQYSIALARNRGNVEAIFDTMRILPDGATREDIRRKIARYYSDNQTMIIHSDPFIIVGQK